MGYAPAGLRDISKAQKIYDTEHTSANINTTPIDVSTSLFPSDKYDYHVSVIGIDPTSNADLKILPNSDTGATNYHQAYMRGQSSSPSGFVDATDDTPLGHEFFRTGTTPSFIRLKITGMTGDERKFTSQYGADSRVYVNDGYWDNTVDEITSLRFTASASSTISTLRIIVFATLKEHSTSEWELVDTLTWSSESSQKSFTGLDGDRDIEYRVVWEGYRTFTFRLNNDSGSNYKHQDLLNNGGTDLGINETLTEVEAQRITFGLLLQNADFKIKNVSGVERLITWGNSEIGGSGYEQQRSACWWSNTADNITSIDCTPSASTDGVAKLYRKRPTSIPSGDLPWEVVEEVDVSGDFSGGHTFSGLKGDDVTMYRLEILLESSGATTVGLRGDINGDTGNNYDYQYLRSRSSTVDSSSVTSQPFYNIGIVSPSEPSKFIHHIYTKSGEERPSLQEWYCRTNNPDDTVRFDAGWWTNTADEITSLEVHAITTDVLTGKIILSRLR